MKPIPEVALGWFGVFWRGRATLRTCPRWLGQAGKLRAQPVLQTTRPGARVRRLFGLPLCMSWLVAVCSGAAVPHGRPGRAEPGKSTELGASRTSSRPACSGAFRICGSGLCKEHTICFQDPLPQKRRSRLLGYLTLLSGSRARSGGFPGRATTATAEHPASSDTTTAALPGSRDAQAERARFGSRGNVRPPDGHAQALRDATPNRQVTQGCI